MSGKVQVKGCQWGHIYIYKMKLISSEWDKRSGWGFRGMCSPSQMQYCNIREKVRWLISWSPHQIKMWDTMWVGSKNFLGSNKIIPTTLFFWYIWIYIYIWEMWSRDKLYLFWVTHIMSYIQLVSINIHVALILQTLFSQSYDDRYQKIIIVV